MSSTTRGTWRRNSSAKYLRTSDRSRYLCSIRRQTSTLQLRRRQSEYQKSKLQLVLPTVPTRFVEFGSLLLQDARNIAQKVENAGLSFPNFSEYDLERRARIILDKEKGYGGDLLSALFSLTTHENFEQKIFEDYEAAGSGLPRQILNLVAVVHAFGFQLPMDYVAGALGEKLDAVSKCVAEDLAGVVLNPAGSGSVKCRHRVIAKYYFDNCIAGKGDLALMLGLLEFLSRQFTVEDIRFHPLPYRIYTELISFEFLYDTYFSKNSRKSECERLYNDAQKFFGRDGIFWLHFGRFYRKIGRLDDAIDCFRTGLEFFGSYQTRHQLGLALLERYLLTRQRVDFDQGLDLLNKQRIERSQDPYPTATLLMMLCKILNLEPGNSDALEKAKDCFNKGMKAFRTDRFFNESARDYLTLGVKP
jgi:tetratricopeptide (TPR) repeat protein